MPGGNATVEDLRIFVAALKKLGRQTGGTFVANSGSVEDEIGGSVE